MIAVLLADDHTLVREGLCRLLEQAGGIAVQGQASNGGEALRLLAQRPWDLLVLDMSMPGRDGVDLIRQIRRDHPAVPILVLTMHGEQQYAVQAIKAGAAGYLTKDCAAAQLEGRAQGSGRRPLPEPLDRRKHRLRTARRQQRRAASAAVRPRIRRVPAPGPRAEKRRHRQAAVPERQDDQHLQSRILVKMRLRNQADLIRYALKHRLIDADDDAGN